MVASLLGAAGVGLEVGGALYGALGSAGAARKKAESEKQIAELEMQADQQRRQAMEINARRQMMQTVRDSNQAFHLARAAAVAGGSQFSSALQGAQSTGTDIAGQQISGTSLALQTGEKLFDINQQIDIQKLGIAQDESRIAQAQAIGGAISGVGKAVASF